MAALWTGVLNILLSTIFPQPASPALKNIVDPRNTELEKVMDGSSSTRRLFKKSVQHGRSERRGEAYSVRYGEPLSEARTTLADVFNSLLDLPLRLRYTAVS